MADPRAGVRAAVLTGAIVISPPDATRLGLRRGPAIVVHHDGGTAPLDLEGPRFVYRLLADGTAVPVPERRHGRCRCPYPHR